MNRIAVKLALFFFGIILFSTVASFIAVSFLSHQVADEVATDQLQIAQTIQALRDKTEMSLDEILDVVADQNYRVEEVASLDPDDFDATQREWLEEDEIVRLGWGRFEGTTTLVRFAESYVAIELQAQRSILQIWFTRLWNTIALFVLISATLILVLASKVVNPILRLTEATQQVARGDFDVQLEIDRNDEVGRLTRNFNHMVQELRTIEYLRKDFISNVSHELKTPLASIKGYAKLLQEDRVPAEERREYASVIVQETSRLVNMSSTMLTLSKLENQSEPGSETVFSLDEQIRRTIVVLEPQWSAKNINLNINLTPTEIYGNEELLQQVWINLLTNAIKFSDKDDTIDVFSHVHEQTVVVSVRDYGIGIDPEDVSRVFEKFFQVDRTRAGEGSGLGLPLVRRIVSHFGGSIDVESTPNQGTTFTVSIPERTYE